MCSSVGPSNYTPSQAVRNYLAKTPYYVVQQKLQQLGGETGSMAATVLVVYKFDTEYKHTACNMHYPIALNVQYKPFFESHLP